MANVFFDQTEYWSAIRYVKFGKNGEGRKILWRIQKSVNLSEIMASAEEYTVLTTGKIGNAKLLNLNANIQSKSVFYLGANLQ